MSKKSTHSFDENPCIRLCNMSLKVLFEVMKKCEKFDGIRGVSGARRRHLLDKEHFIEIYFMFRGFYAKFFGCFFILRKTLG